MMARTQKYMKKEEDEWRARLREYPASGNNDFAQGAPSMVQGFQHGRNSLVETLPLHALSAIVEGEECRRWVLWIRPPEQGLISCGQVAASRRQGQGRFPARPLYHHHDVWGPLSHVPLCLVHVGCHHLGHRWCGSRCCLGHHHGCIYLHWWGGAAIRLHGASPCFGG